MESNDKLKETDIKNPPSSYFDDIIQIEDFANILIDKKSYENILAYSISYQILIEAKPLRIRFAKMERFNRVYDGTRYLVLFGTEKYGVIYNKIRFISQKSGTRYVIAHNYSRIKIDSYEFLPLEKIIGFA